MPQSKSKSIINHVPMAGSMVSDRRPGCAGDSISGFGKRATMRASRATCRRLSPLRHVPAGERRLIPATIGGRGQCAAGPADICRAILKDASLSQFIAILVDPGCLLNRR
jgi:hypothetical protein